MWERVGREKLLLRCRLLGRCEPLRRPRGGGEGRGHIVAAERPKKTKIGTTVAHVTRDSDTTFKIKRSKVNLLLMS